MDGLKITLDKGIGMNGVERVLILSVSAGSGHIKAGEAVIEALKDKNPHVIVKHEDGFQYASPLLNHLIIGTYMKIIKNTPKFYGYLYQRAETNGPSHLSKHEFNRIVTALVGNKIEKLIKEFQPQVIICTHPFTLGIVAELKKKGRIAQKIVGVVTDFTVHPFWFYQETDLYFVAAEEQRQFMVSRGIMPEKVKVTGIPIAKKFSQEKEVLKLKEQLGLDLSLPIVLVMGGGDGFGPVSSIMDNLSHEPLPFQLVIVVGKNVSLYKRLLTEASNLKQPIKVLGFIDNIDEYMNIADVIITKPGGLTTAEAMAKGLPLLIVDPIPGQETRNTEFLINKLIAIKIDGNFGMVGLLKELLNNPYILNNMRSKARTLGRPQAANEVVQALEELC
jgi:processive 1,2-diacylglycerol beta-glucosyltransferase